MRWRDRNHPHLHLREIDPAFCQDWVSQLREQVEAGLMKPRTFNRRIAAISSLYRWAAEPSRSAVTGVPRNPMPPRSLLHAEKSHPRGQSDEQMGLLMAAIARAAHLDRNAKRDYALVRGSYLLGCRVSEIAVIKWKDIEVLSDGGQIHLFGKGSKARTVRVSSDTLELFQALGRGEADSYVFPSPRWQGTSHSTSDWRCLPEVGTSRRFPRSPTPAEAQPCHTRCAEGRGRIHASSHPRTFVERDNWSLRR